MIYLKILHLIKGSPGWGKNWPASALNVCFPDEKLK